MAAESDSTRQRLAHVAEPKVDAVGGQADGGEDQVGAERHRLHRNTEQTGCFLSSFTLLSADLLPDLLAVVAVVNQEVLLKRQLLLPIRELDQGHLSGEVFLRLVCMVQEGWRAAEHHLHLVVAANSPLL